MIKHFVKILELLGDRLEVCVSVLFGWASDPKNLLDAMDSFVDWTTKAMPNRN